MNPEPSERQKAERALRLMHFAVEHAIDAVFWIGPDRRFRYVNPAGCRLLGYSGAELLKMTICDIDPSFSSATWEHFWNDIRRLGSLRLESRHRAKDGRFIPVDMGLSHLEFEGDELVFAYARDVSERKRAEDERNQLLEFEKTARVQAEAASRAKDEFLAIVSHELRTPITAILGWSWLLRSGKLKAAENDRALEIIERNMLTQKKIVEDLLDVSSLAKRQISLRLSPIELAGLLEKTSAEIQALPEAKGKTFFCDAQKGLMVKGDPERIAQVFRNLLDNAVKYTPAAGTITARLSVEQDRALFVVEDTGPGIAQDFYPHLFELFRQQEESLTRQHRGLGLGLALVKHIAELHGGMAWADPPAAGKGACFRVSLPLMRE